MLGRLGVIVVITIVDEVYVFEVYAGHAEVIVEGIPSINDIAGVFDAVGSGRCVGREVYEPLEFFLQVRALRFVQFPLFSQVEFLVDDGIIRVAGVDVSPQFSLFGQVEFLVDEEFFVVAELV